MKQPNGGVKLNQLFHPTAAGAATGAFWGTLIGMLFLMPLAGGALGAALTDVWIDDNFMKEAAQTLQSGNAALFVLIRKMTTDKVLAALQGVGGTVMRTSFDHTKEEALRQARSLQEEGKFELWDRQRLVGRFDSSPRFSPTQG